MKASDLKVGDCFRCTADHHSHPDKRVVWLVTGISAFTVLSEPAE